MQQSTSEGPDGRPFVELSRVEKRFGNVAAVFGVSFAVERGEFVTLLGPSGSGKSTILRMIAGFTPPDHGEIVINKRAVSQIPPYRRSIGVVFQSLALFPHLTVAGNVAYPLKCRRYDRREIPDLVEEYLRIVRLQGLGARRVGELSGGQRQRVAIARALVFKPDLLLLDEPLAALDKKLREEVQLELRRIQSDLGVTTINVTHDQREALVMSDKVMVLSGGRLQQFGPPTSVYRHPANGFVASFIGQTNVFPYGVTTAREGFIAISKAARQGEPMPMAPVATADQECALRAECVKVGSETSPPRDVDVSIPARVRTAAYEGDRVLYDLEVPSISCFLRALDSDPIEQFVAGDAVCVGWRLSDMIELKSDPSQGHH